MVKKTLKLDEGGVPESEFVDIAIDDQVETALSILAAKQVIHPASLNLIPLE